MSSLGFPRDFLDIFLGFLPVLFIVLAIFAIRLDDQPISEHGNRVIQLSRLGPSIYPIIFAAVAGNLMKRLALWFADRGTTLGVS